MWRIWRTLSVARVKCSGSDAHRIVTVLTVAWTDFQSTRNTSRTVVILYVITGNGVAVLNQPKILSVRAEKSLSRYPSRTAG